MSIIKNSIKLTDMQMFKIWMFNVQGQLSEYYSQYLEDCFLQHQSPFSFYEFSAMMYQRKRHLIIENLN
jgi:hypothetical protein